MPVVVSPPRVKRIPLTRGLFALVDTEDYDRLTKSSWCAIPHSRKRDHINVHSRINGKLRYLHHEVLNFKFKSYAKVVDNINRNNLDNRKANLRIISQRENVLNSAHHLNAKGYYFATRDKRWIARAWNNGKPIYLGSSKNEEVVKKLVEEYRASNPFT